MARKLIDLNLRTNLCGVLPAIRVPPSCCRSVTTPTGCGACGRRPDSWARFVEAAGTDSYDWPGADDPETDVIEEFLTGRKPSRTLSSVSEATKSRPWAMDS